MTGPIVVVKVGGSLLDWPELPSRLRSFLAERRDDRVVLVVGGGRFADVLRTLDATHALGEEACHVLALRVLDVTAHLLETLLTGAKVAESMTDLDVLWAAKSVPIFAPRQFLEDDDQSSHALPHTWTTTTDSIAARLATRLEASELILLKSVNLPTGMNWNVAAGLGIVDPEFARSAARIPIVAVRNLRET